MNKSYRLNTKMRKKAMILAMNKTLCIVSISAKMVGISRKTHYQWLKQDSDYKHKIDECKEIALDFVEAALFKCIEQGKTTAIIFHLKTKGFKRGYSQYYQHSNPNVLKSEFDKMNDTELLEYLNL